MRATQKIETRGGSHSPRLLMCWLAAPAVPVQPLAYVVANYTRSYRHQKADYELHSSHPLPVASIGKGSKHRITQFDKFHKIPGEKKRGPGAIPVLLFFGRADWVRPAQNPAFGELKPAPIPQLMGVNAVFIGERIESYLIHNGAGHTGHPGAACRGNARG